MCWPVWGGLFWGSQPYPCFEYGEFWIQGKQAPANPWRAIGLEWLVSSPPPIENFEELPIVIAEPYGYGKNEPLTANLEPQVINE